MFKVVPSFVFQDANAAIAYYEEFFDAKLLSKNTAADPAFYDRYGVNWMISSM